MEFHTAIGDAVPSFSFETEKGKKANITDYKGKLILINFFATWCGPCLLELPEAQTKIWDKYKDNPNFAFFVFGRGEDWPKLDSFKQKKGFTFPILPDNDKKIFSKFAATGIPRNVIVDGDGKIVYQLIGYSEAEFDKLVKFIESKLKK